MKTPLLLISDSITSPTGLARITRELAIRIHANLSDTFRLGVAGFGGTYSRKFDFPQYQVTPTQNMQIPELPYVWKDFAGDEEGILFFIENASWLTWFTDPSTLPDGDLKSFLQVKPFNSWLYCPVDSEGPNGRLSEAERKVFQGFDRVLAYTKFGADVIDRTMGVADEDKPQTSHLPHGTDQKIFYPRSCKEARETLIGRVFNKPGKINEDVTLLGVCATNTSRKDWGLAFETCGELLKRGVNIGLWAHTDRFQKEGVWDLCGLADAFGMRDRVMFSNAHLSDEDMAWAYAACDATLGIGSEGWGLPISESLAMGIPCITGDYAGAADFTPKNWKITPAAFRYDGYFANKRPVFRAYDWADRVEFAMGRTERLSLLSPEHFWDGCWPQWEQWFREGEK